VPARARRGARLPSASSPTGVLLDAEAVRHFYLHGCARRLSSLSSGSPRGHGENRGVVSGSPLSTSMPPPS
jgi:hypothetical protein